MQEPSFTQPVISPDVKLCRICQCEKPASDFPSQSRICRLCRNARQRAKNKSPEYKAWRAAYNRSPTRKMWERNYIKKAAPKARRADYAKTERSKAGAARYRELPEVKKKYSDLSKTPKYRSVRKIYAASQRGKAVGKNYRHKRRLRIEQDAAIESSAIEALCRAAKRCHYCEKAFTHGRMKTLDHVTPLSKGGGHALDNFAVCCQFCNSSKRAMPPDQWAKKLGRLLV